MNDAVQSAAVNSIGAGYTAVNTHPVLLKFALAYSKVKVAMSASADYSGFDRTSFGIYFRPEWLWWSQIPFGVGSVNTGVKNVKVEFDRLLAIKDSTVDAQVAPLYQSTTVLNGDFTFGGQSVGTDSQKMTHFKGLAVEVQKQVCSMQALVSYSRYY